MFSHLTVTAGGIHHLCVYTYMLTHTHPSHFLRYALLVKGWTPFASRSCCRSVIWDDCPVPARPRGALLDRDVVTGGLWAAVNSLSCSIKQFELSLVTCFMMLLDVAIRWYTGS